MHMREIIEARQTLLQRLQATVPIKLTGRIPDAELLAAYKTLTAGHTPGKVQTMHGRNRDAAIKTIGHALKEVARLFDGWQHQPGSAKFVVIYRGITVNQDWINHLSQPHQKLGAHWSLTEEMVMGDLGYDDDEGGSYGHFVLTGSVPPESIDWASTIPELADGVEMEIVLHDGAPIELNGVEPADYNFKFSSDHKA